MRVLKFVMKMIVGKKLLNLCVYISTGVKYKIELVYMAMGNDILLTKNGKLNIRIYNICQLC